MTAVDQTPVHEAVLSRWTNDILPSLSGLVEIPALSPAFDPDWARTGQLKAAVDHVGAWITASGLPGAAIEVVELDGRTPVLLLDVPATPGAEDKGTVLLYGHLDKQPPVGGWSEGLDPWTPVIKDGRLYGRGAVDDGYAAYAATAALEAVHAANGSHARAVVLLETAEESGSPDLPAYVDHLQERLGHVSLVICLDAGGGDYERLWLVNSLRGLLRINVTVRVLDSAQHSGLASGVVPSSFRILRELIERIENATTGEIKLPEFNVEIPDDRRAQARGLVDLTPGAIRKAYPLANGVKPVSDDDLELVLNNTWRPTMSVIGASGLPEPLDAGNVLREATTLTLSFRLPPSADATSAMTAVRKVLTTDVPYSAEVGLGGFQAENGWNAPAEAPWLSAVLKQVSDQVFGAPHQSAGMGGSIPFMGMLGEKYPEAQFVVTGACGPDSNIHVPDEWLHIEHAQRVTEAVAHILHAHARS